MRDLKSTLQYIGLYDYVLGIRSFIIKKYYRNINRFIATVNDVSTQFSTEDEYSKSWFFPRYAGGRMHEKVVTEMLIEALQSASCFVDVGAHLGWYTCIAAKHIPSGRVYGFEMDDLSFALLEQNITINNCTNVDVYNLAVYDFSGMVSYIRDSKRPNPSLHLQANKKDQKSSMSVSVDSVILDEFVKSERIVPNVIKIDVEGAEMNVLKGMRQTMREYRPILFLEIHPTNLSYFNSSTSDVLSLLIEYGYRVFEIEDMRSQKSMKRLNPLVRDSILEKNGMLYATSVMENDLRRLSG